MKDFLKNLFSFEEENPYFDSPQYKQLKNHINNQRNIAIENFAANLKLKYFFNDEEVETVLNIVKKAQEKIDKVNNKVDFLSYGANSAQNYENQLNKIRAKMLQDVENKIKEILSAKVKRAKEYFKNKNNPSNS